MGKGIYVGAIGLEHFFNNAKNYFARMNHKHKVSDIADFPNIPTKVSELVNDSGYISKDQNTTYTISKIDNQIILTGSDNSEKVVKLFESYTWGALLSQRAWGDLL